MTETPRPPLRFGQYDYAGMACMFSYAACSVIIPLCLVAIAGDLGFSLEDDPANGGGDDSGGSGGSLGGLLHMARSAAIVASMLYSGLAAAKWGMTRSLAASMLLMAGGMVACALSPVYGLLLAAVLLAGLGEGIIEALATPYVQDLHIDQPGRYLNFIHGFWSVGIVTATLGLGFLLDAGVNWRWCFFGLAILLILPYALLMAPNAALRAARRMARQTISGRGAAEMPAEAAEAAEAAPNAAAPAPRLSHRGRRLPSHSAADIWRQAVDIMRRRHFWLFFAAMFFAGGGEFGMTFWIASFVKVQLQSTFVQAGVATACFAGGMMAGRLLSGVFVPQRHLARLIVATGLAAVVGSFVFAAWRPEAPPPETASAILDQTAEAPLATAPSATAALATPPPETAAAAAMSPAMRLGLVFGLLFLIGLATAPFWPSIQSYCADRIPDVDTTMLFILLSCAGVPGCGFFTLAMGWVRDRGGFYAAFWLVPAAFLCMSALIAWDVLLAKKQKNISLPPLPP